MVAAILSPTQSEIQVPLVQFLESILPPGIGVYAGQDNRVPEPNELDYVVFTPLFRDRLSTNVDTYEDNLFVGSVSGTELLVSSIVNGVVEVGRQLFGVGVLDDTVITALGSGTGGAGTYVVSRAQSVASKTLAAGCTVYLQATKLTMQLDVHGPHSSNYAQVISTILRDDYAVNAFEQLGGLLTPLDADDPKQMPFTNAEQQYEERWTMDAKFQVNQVVRLPQQFADVVDVEYIPVNVFYPA